MKAKVAKQADKTALSKKKITATTLRRRMNKWEKKLGVKPCVLK